MPGLNSARAVMFALLAGCAAWSSRAPAAGASAAAARHWTADNGNGTYSNPLFYGEFEDPDVIRVGKDYYLAGTTMHMNPAVEILHSKDLVNWELAGYCTNRLDLGPAYRLEGGNIYGHGIWAPCLRYHQGTFYILCNVNGAGLQVYRAKTIAGPWEHNPLPGRHDMSILFDDDLHKVFIISGGGSPGANGASTYPIEELAPDLRSFDAHAPQHQMVIPRGQRLGEGHHLYKIDGKYYDVSAIPGGPVNQMVARADSIDGPWEVTTMVDAESLGVTAATPERARPEDRGLWLHQGGMCSTPSGQWWSIIMSDHGSAGRMVSLVPITWAEGFPLIGLPGNWRKAPITWVKPDTGQAQPPAPTYVWDDDFKHGRLNPHWQWNHVPDDTKWSLTEHPGALRLHSLPAPDFYHARNSVCQRCPGPECSVTVALDTAGLAVGDTAGLALLCNPYAWLGVVKSDAGTTLQLFRSPSASRRGGGAPPPANGAITRGSTHPPSHLWLRVHCNFDRDQAEFAWSADGKTFTAVGDPWPIPGFQLQTFQGVRPALFNFNAAGQPGGYADFAHYTCDEPRARGIERAIPLGKSITLASGADGSWLAADAQNNRLVSATNAAAADTRFQVLDLGLGRVALKVGNGRLVSVAATGVILKDLAGGKPGDAESFQWINLMRGDTALMSLANHRYLTTVPNVPGPATATATGPTPARKGGECFKWNVIP